MTVFFLVCVWLRLAYVTNLHFVNCLFVAVAICYVVWKNYQLQYDYAYLASFLSGLKVTALASIIFSFFLLIYLRFIDAEFMQHLKVDAPLGEYMSPILIALIFFTEQLSAAVIVTLIVLQFFKTSNTV